MLDTRELGRARETGIDGNCPSWHGASGVYSKAYRLMEEHGSDDYLIEALGLGDEERIKACMLRINGEIIHKRLEATAVQLKKYRREMRRSR